MKSHDFAYPRCLILPTYINLKICKQPDIISLMYSINSKPPSAFDENNCPPPPLQEQPPPSQMLQQNLQQHQPQSTAMTLPVPISYQSNGATTGSEYGEPEETLNHPSEWIAGASRPIPPFPYQRGGIYARACYILTVFENIFPICNALVRSEMQNSRTRLSSNLLSLGTANITISLISNMARIMRKLHIQLGIHFHIVTHLCLSWLSLL